MSKKFSTYFLIYTILVELLTLVMLMLEKSEAGSQFWLGYSLNRWVLILAVMVCLLVSILFLTRIQLQISFSPLEKKLFTNVSATESVVIFVAAVVLLAFFAISYIPGIFNQSYWSRLRPLIVMAALITTGYNGYLRIALHHRPWSYICDALRQFARWTHQVCMARLTSVKLQAFISSKWLPVLLFILTFPLLFSVAIQYTYPAGYGGLFALMSEELAASGFRLPQSVGFYGPGGIPFAYPPVGIYLMAFFTSILHIPPMIYLRFAPPFFMWLSLIPVFLSAKEISHSKTTGIVASILIASSQQIFYVQATSAGIVRGLAFLFAWWGITFFLLAANRDKKHLYAAFAGLFFGLTFLTHLSYAVFAVLFVVSYVIVNISKKEAWLPALEAGVAAILVVTPWVLTMAQRYGWDVFMNASQTHGAGRILLVFSQPEKFIAHIDAALNPLYGLPVLFGMMVLGLLYALFTQNRVAAVWFILLVLITSESQRYLEACGAILIGGLIAGLLSTLTTTRDKLVGQRNVAVFLSLFLISAAISGWVGITATNEPVINAHSFDLANYVIENTPPESKYLVVSGADEGEWFPYLLRREPVAASWGGEWVGNFNQHAGWVLEIGRCQQMESYTCLIAVMDQIPTRPDLLITHQTDASLNRQVTESRSWSILYSNTAYILWGR